MTDRYEVHAYDVVTIGARGAGLRAVSQARHQVCWCHKMFNVSDKLPQRLQPEANALLRDIYTAPTRDEALSRLRRFVQRFEQDYPRAIASLTAHQDELLAYYDFPPGPLEEPAHLQSD